MGDRKENVGKGLGIWLFDTLVIRPLVWTVMGYGTEIWGWKERKAVERVYERYLKLIFKLEDIRIYDER